MTFGSERRQRALFHVTIRLPSSITGNTAGVCPPILLTNIYTTLSFTEEFQFFLTIILNFLQIGDWGYPDTTDTGANQSVDPRARDTSPARTRGRQCLTHQIQTNHALLQTEFKPFLAFRKPSSNQRMLESSRNQNRKHS